MDAGRNGLVSKVMSLISGEKLVSKKTKNKKTIKLVGVKMVKEKNLNYETGPIRKPEDAVKILEKFLDGADREHFVALLLNSKNYVNEINVVSVGTLSASLVHPREVFKAAILANSAGVIFGHNHPSGDPEPSHEDIEVTNRLIEVGKIIGIEVLDSVVIGCGKFESLKVNGFI